MHTRVVPDPDGGTPPASRQGSKERRPSKERQGSKEGQNGRRGAPAGGGRRRGGGDLLSLGQSEADRAELELYSSKWGRFRVALGEFMESTPVELSIVVLVFGYALLVFAMLLFSQEIDRWEHKKALDWIDFIVLFIFLTEIGLKSLAFGKPFYSDPWNIFDAFIVTFSIGLGVLNFISTDETVKRILSLRGLLRLLRLVVIFRKVSETQGSLSRLRQLAGGVDLSSPVEKVLDTLNQLAHNPRLPRRTRFDVMYAIRVVSGGNLYDIDTDLGGAGGQVAAEASAWIANATAVQNKEKDGKEKKAFNVQVTGIGEYTMKLIQAYSAEVRAMLEIEMLERWDYDMFFLDRETKCNALPLMSTRLLKSTGLWDNFVASESKFEAFITRIRDGYIKANPYHNAIHATDVMQTAFWFCNTGGMIEILGADSEQFFSMIFAAVIHDVGHPAVNNIFYSKIGHPVALRYNDKSVMENMHIAFSYNIMHEDAACDIFSNLKGPVYDKIRSTVISLVLATDMSFHFAKLGKIRSKIQSSTKQNPFPDPSNQDDRTLLMEVALHACDISNPAKKTNIYLSWTDRVLTEFFNQGDREKAADLPPSMFMDRDTTNIAKCQIGFIDIIVNPLFEVIHDVLPALDEACDWLAKNKAFWVPKVDMMEAQMKAGDFTLPPPPSGEIQTDEAAKAPKKEPQPEGEG